MSLWFLLIASSTFHVITDAHPLLSTDQLVESDSLGLWDNGDIPSEQLFGGASGSSLLLDSSDTAGYGIFTLDDSSNSNGIENDLGWLSSSSDLGLVSMDETTNFALDAEGVGGNLAENPGCTSQTRKRDESDNIILAGAICREREENGNKEDPGKIPTPEFRSPFDVEPWTCPLDFFKMCCTGLIGPDGRALGCAYFDENNPLRCTIWNNRLCCKGQEELQFAQMGQPSDAIDDPYGVGCIEPTNGS